jgi:hypothetical protein
MPESSVQGNGENLLIIDDDGRDGLRFPLHFNHPSVLADLANLQVCLVSGSDFLDQIQPADRTRLTFHSFRFHHPIAGLLIESGNLDGHEVRLRLIGQKVGDYEGRGHLSNLVL